MVRIAISIGNTDTLVEITVIKEVADTPVMGRRGRQSILAVIPFTYAGVETVEAMRTFGRHAHLHLALNVEEVHFVRRIPAHSKVFL